MQHVNTLTMSVEDTGNATALVKRLDDGRVLVVHDTNFGHDLDAAPDVQVLLYRGTREWQDSGWDAEASLTLEGPGHAVITVDGSSLSACRRHPTPTRPEPQAPTHVVVDCGYVFWKDSDGKPFDLEAAVCFAADRNAGQFAVTYKVMELVPTLTVDVEPDVVLVSRASQSRGLVKR